MPANESIPLSKCRDAGFYRIDSRNLTCGVFRESTGGFIGIRLKFGNAYLFEEYHVDNGPPFGTVTPQEFLEDCPIRPINEDNAELFQWIKKKKASL